MNVYDFDGTLRYGDTTADFYLWCLVHHPAIFADLPGLAVKAVKWYCGKATKLEFKQHMYRFLRRVPDIDGELQKFWLQARKKMMDWYTPHEGDVIISASPEFLLAPMCEELGVALIASRVDPRTGVCDGLNCHGEEKVRRFRQLYPDAWVDEFCSDSLSDTPLALLADRAYLIRGGKKHKWMEAGRTV